MKNFVAPIFLSGLVLASVGWSQEEGEGIERDVGFSHNGYSYSSDYRGNSQRIGLRTVRVGDGLCEVCEIHRYDGLGLVYRGLQLDTAFQRSRVSQGGQLFDVRDEAGVPLGAVNITLSRAGYDGAASGVTNQAGQVFLRLQRPRQTHRVLLQAPGHQPLVYELTGGALGRNHHRVTLARGTGKNPVRQRFVPLDRAEPNKDAVRAYRSAMKRKDAGKDNAAIADLTKAIDIWPVAGGMAGGSEYSPYVELSGLLRKNGRDQEAAEVVRRGLEPGHTRSAEAQAELNDRHSAPGAR